MSKHVKARVFILAGIPVVGVPHAERGRQYVMGANGILWRAA